MMTTEVAWVQASIEVEYFNNEEAIQGLASENDILLSMVAVQPVYEQRQQPELIFGS
jgi:hypothetical protein